MNILVVCQHYWPEQFQITDICEDLARRGHQVTVLAGLPNYGMTVDGIGGRRPGRVLPEYRGAKGRVEVRNGVVIVRAYEFGRGSNLLARTVNYYSYWKSACKMAPRLPDDYDVVFAYQLSPGMMAAPAKAYRDAHGTPMLLYCCDLWPESMKAGLGDRGAALVRHYGRICGDIYRAADIVAMQSPAFAGYFQDYHGIPADRLVYVPQFATDDTAGGDLSDDHAGVNLVFMGNMGRVQGIDMMVRAMALLRDEPGLRLHFVGDGVCLDDAKRLAHQLSVTDTVLFHGRKPAAELAGFYRMADACVMALDDSSAIGLTVPSKLQGYMAAGKPVIAAVGGGARMVIEDAACGYTVDYGDAAAFAGAVRRFVADRPSWGQLGANGREYYQAHFTRERHVDRIEALLECCAHPGGRGHGEAERA